MKTLLVIAAILLNINVKASDNSPLAFYSDLVKSINTAQGNMLVSLGEGLWSKRLGGTEVLWRNDANTVATFAFNYQAGNLQKGSYLAFSPAIHIWVKGSVSGLSLAVDTIFLNQLGSFAKWKTHYDNLRGGKHAPVDVNELDKIQAVLSADIRAEKMFQGELFLNYLLPKPIDEHFNARAPSEPFLKKLYFLSTNDIPALALGLARGASLHISKKTSNLLSDNNIVLSRTDPSFAKFDYLKYDFEDHSIEGKLADFEANLDGGYISSNTGFFLTLLPSSKLKFDNLEFQRSAQFTSIDCKSGSLFAGVSSGSRINLSSGAGASNYIVFDDNSTVALSGFAINVSDGESVKILVTGGSTINLNVRDAQFAIGQDSYVDISPGQLAAALNGDWTSTKSPEATLKVSNLNATISGGKIALNNATKMTLLQGSVKSTDLTLANGGIRGLTGVFSNFDVELAEESQIGLPNGFQMIVGPGGSELIGATPADPMILESSYPYPLSTYHLSLSFRKFQNALNPILGLSNGKIDLTLRNFDSDSIAISNSTVAGDFAFQSPDAKITGRCTLYEIKGFEMKGQPQSLSGKIKLNVFPGLSYDIHTGFKSGPGDEERTFPLNFLLETHDSILSSEGTIALQGRQLQIHNLTYNATLQLIVPTGGGEHSDKNDPNSAHNTDPGDLSMRNAQEVYRDHNSFGVGGCTFHIYLMPHTYNPSGDFYIETDASNSVNISLSHLQLNEILAEDTHFKKNGCDGAVIGTIFGAIIGTLTGGAGGAIVAGIIGGIAGESIESSIKTKMLAEIASKIESEKGTWRLSAF